MTNEEKLEELVKEFSEFDEILPPHIRSVAAYLIFKELSLSHIAYLVKKGPDIGETLYGKPIGEALFHYLNFTDKAQTEAIKNLGEQIKAQGLAKATIKHAARDDE